jgi:hypothetical protein
MNRVGVPQRIWYTTEERRKGCEDMAHHDPHGHEPPQPVKFTDVFHETNRSIVSNQRAPSGYVRRNAQ